MAKIKAGNDRELARWRRVRGSSRDAPYELLITGNGRLLIKREHGDSWKRYVRHISTLDVATKLAADWGMHGGLTQ